MLQSFRWRWLFACIAILLTATLSGAAEFDKFLPKETDLIVSLNVRQMVDSPLGKEFASDLLKSLLANNKQTQLALEDARARSIVRFQSNFDGRRAEGF